MATGRDRRKVADCSSWCLLCKHFIFPFPWRSAVFHRSGPPGRALGAGAVLCLALTLTLPTVPALAAPPGPAAEADPLPALVAGNGTAAPQLVTGLSDAAPGTPAEAALAHLAAHPDRYHVDTAQLRVLAVEHSADGRTTVRFQQYHGGLPVRGGQYLVHLLGEGADRRVEAVGGKYFTGLTAPTAPALPAEALRTAALDSLPSPQARSAATVDDLGPTVLPGGTGRLAQHFVVRFTDPSTGKPTARETYVDATSGTVALAYATPAPSTAGADGPAAARTAATTPPANPAPAGEPAVGTATDLRGRTVPVNIARMPDGSYRLVDLTRGSGLSTYDAAGQSYFQFQGNLPEGSVPVSSAGPDFPASAGAGGAVDAHRNAAAVYDFYRDRFGRDGIDGTGGPVTSVVNTSDAGEPWPGAMWSGKMLYGNGDAEHLPFSADLDVTGHEMTHGVIHSTANLDTGGQPGAMNEGLADYMGAAVDATANGIPMTDPRAALIGGSLCHSGTPQECARRRLDGHRTTADHFVGADPTLDAGGVHVNSMIFSGALWDIRRTLDPLTADRLVYRTITSYLTPLDDFVDGRHAVLAAARSLGLDRAALRTVAAAFDAHGIKAGWQDRIRTDSQTLLRGTAGVDRPAVGGGRWVMNVSEDADDWGPLFTGSTTSSDTPVRLSPQDGRQHTNPATDGHTAAWRTTEHKVSGDDIQTVRTVMTRSLSGGPARTVFTSTNGIGDVRVSGGDIAFLADRPGSNVPGVWLSHDGAPAAELPLPEGHARDGLTLKNGRVGWIETWIDGDNSVQAPTIHSIATGQTTQYPMTRAGTHGTPPGIPGVPKRPKRFMGDPHFVGDRLVWAEQAPNGGIGIRSGAADGSGVTDLVPSDAPLAPLTKEITVSDQAVTFEREHDRPASSLSNADLSKLYQVPVTGGTPVRVSCNRGRQSLAAADTGTRVVWIDGTRGRVDLMVRDRPARSC
ncbi:M4 family metallopeptidase [Kitasatospora sp. NPDC008115]|uniref:M4 family metallopeptidase n=1 Tax=Kitasatospora sp. NPDC008115 TaxID=3364022 RepID=UPI0036E6EB16